MLWNILFKHLRRLSKNISQYHKTARKKISNFYDGGLEKDFMAKADKDFMTADQLLSFHFCLHSTPD